MGTGPGSESGTCACLVHVPTHRHDVRPGSQPTRTGPPDPCA